MNSAMRKSLFILVMIMTLEGVPWVLTLASSKPGALSRLYGFDAAAPTAWTAAAIVAFGYILYAARALPLVRRRFFEPHAIKAIALPFAIVTGTMEELWFRKLVMDGVASHGAGAAVQITASALIFGMAHGIWGLFGRQWMIALGATIATGLLGGLLAGVYLIAGRSVAPCVWAHMLINLAIEPWLMVAAVSAGSTMRDGKAAPV